MYMHKHMVIGVAGVALLAACATPIRLQTIQPTKKYDDCVASEKARYRCP